MSTPSAAVLLQRKMRRRERGRINQKRYMERKKQAFTELQATIRELEQTNQELNSQKQYLRQRVSMLSRPALEIVQQYHKFFRLSSHYVDDTSLRESQALFLATHCTANFRFNSRNQGYSIDHVISYFQQLQDRIVRNPTYQEINRDIVQANSIYLSTARTPNDKHFYYELIERFYFSPSTRQMECICNEIHCLGEQPSTHHMSSLANLN